ncbi:hypothetical protein CESP606_11710 [Cereibacter sphaeroides]|uniref:hypothetical protein n=1 Tax=Cereibacter sphaeroides TaxID=1063 RepID=UPI0039EE5DD1
MPLAPEEITLTHREHTLRLRPSLRAALILERLHDGFARLFEKLDEANTQTLHAIIRTAATDPHRAESFLASARNVPLAPFLRAVQAPVAALCEGLLLPPDESSKPTPKAKPLPWVDALTELYKIGTGWLGWTPAETLNATPAEIILAFDGRIAQLKALHGTADEADPGDTARRERNLAEGLDPDFDREGLRALAALAG